MGSRAMHSTDHTAIPRVSVIMATYNGARFVRQSINSVLAQTLADVELIVVDDCSTDATPAILQSIADPRLLVLRNAQNLGVVDSRNRCFEHARGAYVAMLDHDDLSRPRRLEQQAAYLDAHPGTVLIGTASHLLQAGRVLPPRLPGETSPALIGWLLLVANPLVCSSVMFRAEAARRLDPFMRPGYAYADDFDLYHRLKPFGAIARLDEPLTLYRLHDENSFRKHEEVMTENAVRVLAPLYEPWFGDGALAAARLIAGHLAAGRPVMSLSALRDLQACLRRLTDRFLAEGPVAEADRLAIQQQAEAMWQRLLRQSARHGRFAIGRAESSLYGGRPASAAEAAGRLFERLPFQEQARTVARSLLSRPSVPARPAPPLHAQGTRFEPADEDDSAPPTMFVVVDTEAEFDWTRPFERGFTSVHAIDQVERGQAVFDRYGLRPIYVVDYPIATEPRSIARLLAILARGGCEIGAHLHPWTTPPFAEEVSSQNSYPGNLPAALEREKLAQLLAAIEENFGVRPLFYKAGRYGFGPHTAAALADAGIRVDLSVLPGADLRRDGGPDFRALTPRPYWIGGRAVLSVPMTRSPVGLLPPLGALTEQWHRSRLLRLIPLQAAFSRARIVDTITLTPEGVTAEEQIRLLRALLRRGTRQFVLHYHSPSLEAGHTSYTSTEASVVEFVRRLDIVCRYFFETVGGMPGFPRDLVPVAEMHEASALKPILRCPDLAQPGR
jgi:hypothetical protein